MQIDWSTFWLAKEGNAAEECEDALFFRRGSQGDRHAATFAVADGATESMLSRQWANVLVRQFCRRESGWPLIDEEFLEQAHRLWQRWRSSYLRRREAEGRSIRWYEEEGLRAGAFSTLLGLTLIENPRMWVATAVGDSCVFQVRRDCVRAAFPIRDPTEFGNRPPLICSKHSCREALLKEVRHTTGRIRPGDRFYLATDALACWFLQRYNAGEEPWRELDELGNDAEQGRQEAWVSELRRGGLLRNDDVAVFSIAVRST